VLEENGWMADELRFKVGDKAVCPAQGVAEVTEVVQKEIAGQTQEFYVLRVLDSNMKVMIPTRNAHAVGLREVASRAEIREVMAILGEPSVYLDNQTWNRRYRGFMEKIRTGSLYDLAEVFRDLSRLKNEKQLSFGERRMLETARSLIVKELAVARKVDEEKVRKEIEAPFACATPPPDGLDDDDDDPTEATEPEAEKPPARKPRKAPARTKRAAG
jgi:CarD family transcriptional regulator